jgi:hypothetical protein
MRNLSWDKKLFLFLLVIFSATGILGLYGPAYWERTGGQQLFRQYWVFQLLLTLSIGLIMHHYVPRIFTRFWESLQVWRKVVLAVGVIFLIFIFTMGIFKFINVSVGRVELPVKGYVYRKWKVRHRKSTDYYLVVRDTASHKQYEFEVKKQVYELAGNPGEAYSNTFYRGCFGVVYRHDIW